MRDPDRWHRTRRLLGWNSSASRLDLDRLPFAAFDATAGSEIELQAVVIGSRESVDLPRTIEASSFYANLQKRSAAQDTPKRALRNLQRFLEHNPDGVWDNSWVRFPRALLNTAAQRVLERDMLADKSRPDSGPRGDGHRFVAEDSAGPLLRIPVSYLLKLALADAIGTRTLPAALAATGQRMLEHFLSDNTSPESFSFNIDGAYHSCNPGAVVALLTPYSKNKRVVTIIDTDVPGGTGCGIVAMIEIVAMMIGRVEQRYSDERYDDPKAIAPGMFLRKGRPKSLYQPGSSTDVLIFQPGRIAFAADLVANQRAAAHSRFTRGFAQPLVETDVAVRSLIARPIGNPPIAVDSSPTETERNRHE